MLRWEETRSGVESEWAYSGDAIIAQVVHQSVGDRLWAYKLNGVEGVGKTGGFVKSKASAKRAVERAWAAWLDHAGLQPKSFPRVPQRVEITRDGKSPKMGNER